MTTTQALAISEITELNMVDEGLRCEIAEPFLHIIQAISEIENQSGKIIVKSVDDKENINAAKKLWQVTKNTRIEAEKIRKSLKEDSLIRGRAIDGLGNYIKAKLQAPEKHLHEQWKYAEIEAEKKKTALIESRSQKLIEAGSTISHAGLGEMSEKDFQQLLEMTQEATKRRIDEQQKLEQIKAENERKEAEEKARIQAENERLKKEADEREAKAKAEREAAEKKLLEEQKKREAAEAEAKRIADAQKEKAEAERLQKENAERKELEEAQKAAAAPDKEKLKRYIETITDVEAPEVNTEQGQKIKNSLLSAEKEFVKYALNLINTL